MPAIDPNEIGLAELVHQMIAETFDAITASRLTQGRNVAEIRALAQSDLETYARLEVDREDIDELLAPLFPTRESDQPHAIYEGSPYVHAGASVEEVPPIRRRTGIELPDSDLVTTAEGSLVLGPVAVTRVFVWARATIATRELAQLRELDAAGLPVVEVNRGQLDIKVSWSVVRGEVPDSTLEGVPGRVPVPGPGIPIDPDLFFRDRSTEEAASVEEIPSEDSRAAEPSPTRTRQGVSALPRRLRSSLKQRAIESGDLSSPNAMRLVVRPANHSDSDLDRLRLDVFGEVRLEFELRR